MMFSHVFVLLQGTQKQGRNELLFQLGVNYNNLLQMFRQGTCLIRTEVAVHMYDFIVTFPVLIRFICGRVGTWKGVWLSD